MIRTRLADPIHKSKSERHRPKVIKWKGVQMLRHHSFNAAIKEVVDYSQEMDVTRVGIVGDMHSGKSTMAEAIAHQIHKTSKAPFKVRKFTKEDLLDFENTLAKIPSVNHILIFDDISFLEAKANKKQISLVKQAVTEIRHLDDGTEIRDVKIILIYNYHYTLGLDKYLRMADFRFFTTVGDSEMDNMERIVGTKRMAIVHDFLKKRVPAPSKGYWTVNIGPKESLQYKWRNPWIPVLFWNRTALRQIVSPQRQWLDPICTICSNARGKVESEVDVEKFKEETEKKYDKKLVVAVLKQILHEQGLSLHSPKFLSVRRYFDRALEKKVFSLEDLAITWDLTKQRRASPIKKMDGVLLE